MTSLTTFYLSGIIGKEVFGADGDAIGVIKDLLINTAPSGQNDPNQQLVLGIKLKIHKGDQVLFVQYIPCCQSPGNDQCNMFRPDRT